MNQLTNGKPIKAILLFAAPLYIGQLFQLFYIFPTVICILRNSMQGFGDTKNDLIWPQKSIVTLNNP